MKKIFLTSFDTWLPHQSSNSSDDLLVNGQFLATNLSFLRRLPVDISRASERVINAIAYQKPDIIICCGMAESRYLLAIESNAIGNDEKLYTSVDLEQLIKPLAYTYISHNAGRFVCEGLYYQVLKHLQSSTQVLFVHVPLLTATNFLKIKSDFQKILEISSFVCNTFCKY